MDDKRKQALNIALGQIEKQFGKGSIMRMDSEAVKDIQVVSTGSLGLDLALGVGGLPRGRVVEIYGPESSGKTTIALHAIAQAQKIGGSAAFIDAEHAMDAAYSIVGNDGDTFYVLTDKGAPRFRLVAIQRELAEGLERGLSICTADGPSRLKLVVLLTDGLPTIGERDAEGLSYVGMAARLLGSHQDANDAFQQSDRGTPPAGMLSLSGLQGR